MTKKKTETVISIEEMTNNMRKSIATDNYVRFKETEMLEALNIDPKTIKRKGGRPRKYFKQESEFPSGFRRIGHSNRHVVQIVFKQKWQAGIVFSNSSGPENNPCFISTAKVFESNPKVISDKYHEVSEEDRHSLEIWLVKLLMAEGLIHNRKLKAAKKILEVENK